MLVMGHVEMLRQRLDRRELPDLALLTADLTKQTDVHQYLFLAFVILEVQIRLRIINNIPPHFIDIVILVLRYQNLRHLFLANRALIFPQLRLLPHYTIPAAVGVAAGADGVVNDELCADDALFHLLGFWHRYFFILLFVIFVLVVSWDFWFSGVDGIFTVFVFFAGTAAVVMVSSAVILAWSASTSAATTASTTSPWITIVIAIIIYINCFISVFALSMPASLGSLTPPSRAHTKIIIIPRILRRSPITFLIFIR